jgi:predicted GNAT family acetyltransferase
MTVAPTEQSAYDVRDNPEMNRYELFVDERVIGIADYRRRGDVMLFPHTVIDTNQRGQGWGAVLVRAALDDVGRQGLRLVAQCWFVAEFIELNPEYRDLAL